MADPVTNPSLTTDGVVQSKFTLDYITRTLELRAAGWTKIKAAAEVVGITKGDDDRWEDYVPQIVEAEFRNSGKDVYAPGYSPESVAANQLQNGRGRYTETPTEEIHSTKLYNALGIRTAKNGDKIRTNMSGGVIN